MKRRQASKARPAAGPAFTPDAFYERLLVMREEDPAAVLRFGRETAAALRAYEEAKRQAERTKKGGKK